MGNILTRIGVALKAAASTFRMSFGRTSGGWRNWANRVGEVDYASSVGDGRGNSIVRAALNWMAKKLPNGVLSMRRILANGDKEDVPTHPFLTLLRRPNDFYSGSTMLKAAHADWTITGDAYLIKLRNGLGSPVQLWYAPSTMIEPVSDDPFVFVQYYRYTPGERTDKLRPEDVIHLRNGIDPNNVRKGLSPLASIARDLFIDDEASRWTAAMLLNGGGPGIMMIPDGATSISPDDIDPMKAQFKQRFGGANRGEPMIASQPIKIERLTWNPKEMDLGVIHDLPEERVCAVLNMPAVVVGMGTGLDSATYSNLASLREVAIEDNLLPTYYDWAEQLKAQLLPDFEPNPEEWEVFFDVSGIRELQPDMDKMVERETRKLLAGGIKLSEYRKNVGEDALKGEEGDVLYIPANVVPTALDAIIPAPLALPAPVPPTTTTGKALDDIETKAIGVMQSIVRLRGRLLDPETRALARLLRKQRDMAIAVLDDVTKGFDLGVVETKETDPAVFERRLRARLEADFSKGTQTELERMHLRSALGVHEIVGQWAGVDLPVDARLRQRYLREAGANVQGVTDYTIRALANTIQASVFANESIEETTDRIRGLHVFSDARAHTIAYNELAQATNRASIQTYTQSGIVEEIMVTDGTVNDPECAAMNGRVFSLADIGSVDLQEHVSCQRAFSPVVRSTTRSAGTPGNGRVDHKDLVAA